MSMRAEEMGHDPRFRIQGQNALLTEPYYPEMQFTMESKGTRFSNPFPDHDPKSILNPTPFLHPPLFLTSTTDNTPSANHH